jgi:cysteine desulfurase
VVGLGEACAIAGAEMAGDHQRIAALRDRLLRGLGEAIAGLQLNADPIRRIPGNLNLTFPGATAQAMLASMPALCVSTGSACSSAEVEPSYVLKALGLSDDQAARTLRIGIGRFTSPADIDAAVAMLARAHAACAPHPSEA